MRISERQESSLVKAIEASGALSVLVNRSKSSPSIYFEVYDGSDDERWPLVIRISDHDGFACTTQPDVSIRTDGLSWPDIKVIALTEVDGWRSGR